MRLYWPEVPPNPPGPMRAHGGASSPAADAQSAWSRFEVREVSRLADAIITAMRQHVDAWISGGLQMIGAVLIGALETAFMFSGGCR